MIAGPTNRQSRPWTGDHVDQILAQQPIGRRARIQSKLEERIEPSVIVQPFTNGETMRKLNAISDCQMASLEEEDVVREGDIVSFRFPVADGSLERPPQIRPCVVLAANVMAATPFVTIAYGVNDDGKGNHDASDFLITNLEEIRKAGLKGPTRFICRHALSVSVNNDSFEHDIFGSPVLGHLTGPALARLHQVREQARAEAVAAAAYRDHRRRKNSLKAECKRPAPCQVSNNREPFRGKPRARAQI
ncbi:hypothetical protein FDK21_20225 [Cohaesibacter sp. CAU 1516]|uniref:hypothetical protein n=1 Tax=Cohaesibacter sp. CAU 1516 TaxID=2576038 RepID=UPI0010FEDE46|nr:hypothetical protein [Cohaesibacter sp. CAU 1516]TLP42161.1 hypothetical protein FDK21_20225 [Cohaesibacter sp. CAU 1516]